MLQVGVVFYLVDAGWDGGGREGRREVFFEVVGYADGARFAGFLDTFHGGPGGLELFVCGGEEGRVDEVACGTCYRVAMTCRGAPDLQVHIVHL